LPTHEEADCLPNPLGEGLVAEVTDLPTSRVFSDALRLWGGFNAVGMGNAVFDMRSFGTGAPSSVLGNRGDSAGYFAFFGRNPTSVTVGAGANLMIQDSGTRETSRTTWRALTVTPPT
jgi:hypothetical protein